MSYQLHTGHTTPPNELAGEEPTTMTRARSVEEYADNLLAECITLAGADGINREHDLYDGILLPQLMQAIAQWSGSSIVGPCNSDDQMRELHNLLANALHTIASKEVA